MCFFELREALRRICVEIGWSYAVFWKAIGSPTPEHLVWEDGHWYGKQQLSHHNSLAEFRTQGEEVIDELVSKTMVPKVHVIGYGMVGQSASAGNHRWVLRDVDNDRDPNLSHFSELKSQFMSGIQTIVIIPILPHGAVQFGSTMRVMENSLFVNYVRTSFIQFLCEQGSSYGVSQKLLRWNSNLQHGAVRTATSDCPFRGDCSNIGKSLPMQCDHQLLMPSKSSSHSSSSLSTWRFENTLNFDSERPPTRKISTSTSVLIAESCQPMTLPDGGPLFHPQTKDMMPSVNEISLATGSLSFMEEKKASAKGMFGEVDPYSPFIPLPTSGDDLFEVLGLYGSLDRGFAIDPQASLDVAPCNIESNLPPSLRSVFSESNTDQLLDAVISQINPRTRHNLDESTSCRTLPAKISASAHYCSSPKDKKRGDLFSPSVLTSNSEALVSTSMRSADSVDETERSACYESQIRQNKRSDKLLDLHIKRFDETSRVNRKRPRPGETPRPRPKDRQLIMDRVKELREIVPNGAKCSIDALLEKTIKHMVFLQSVAKHADKMIDSREPKIISQDGGVILKDNFEGGATWAFEVGSQTMTCPIIVEDLNPPREMLVEMLCEEQGFFLEIADLIRGLGLTILKGVMEARKDKIWARFAVEANRDVTRMEIFLSLVSSLEPTITGTSVHHSINNNMPACVPMTGISNSL